MAALIGVFKWISLIIAFGGVIITSVLTTLKISQKADKYNKGILCSVLSTFCLFVGFLVLKYLNINALKTPSAANIFALLFVILSAGLFALIMYYVLKEEKGIESTKGKIIVIGYFVCLFVALICGSKGTISFYVPSETEKQITCVAEVKESSGSEYKYCPYCGNENSNSSFSYCPKCGEKISK